MIPILDTHLHLIYLDRFSYPWLDIETDLKRQSSVEAYFAEAAALGIKTALHMEVDVEPRAIEAEARFVTELDPRIVGAIAACRPEDSGFPAQLERLSSIEGIRGLRRILHTLPDELSQTALFRKNLRKLTEHRLSFDLCLRANQLSAVGAPLIDSCPDVQFVLDHCGVPDIAGGDNDAWRKALSELARRPNVACKISGIVAYAGPAPDAGVLKPYVEHVIAAFGWERVVWGSDHPVCTRHSSLADWVAITRCLIAGASPDEQAGLLHRNGGRLYRI